MGQGPGQQDPEVEQVKKAVLPSRKRVASMQARKMLMKKKAATAAKHKMAAIKKAKALNRVEHAHPAAMEKVKQVHLKEKFLKERFAKKVKQQPKRPFGKKVKQVKKLLNKYKKH